LNGKIPILEEKHKWPGPYCLRDSKLTHLIWGSPSGGFVNFLGRKSNCTWLQYMDDLLLASHDWEKCWEGTKTLLAWHFKAGYKVPGKKPKFASKRSNTLDCHLRMTMHLGSGEETDYLLHPTDEDQKGSPRILRSGRILLHLDTWIFKPGQTTLQGHSRLWKRSFKLGTRQRKGFPGDKETDNQHPCTRAARCNMTNQSYHL
jgi:hypothetical protein